jgi:hypothetical protein
MFDGHALLIVLVALVLFVVGVWRWSSADQRASADIAAARERLPVPMPPDPVIPITVVCHQCGTEICTVLTPADAVLEDELHHLAEHGGAA